MNETDIRKYAGLMEELGLTGLEITEDNKVVRLERNVPVTAVETVAVSAANSSASAEKPAVTSDGVSIRSPMVGVFYAAPAENSDPYVKIGDRVKRGQTLCIIEAMKLMNEIAAEDDGEIVEICVANAQVVEYGTELFKIRK